MFVQVMAVAFLAALSVNTAAAQTACQSILDDCTAKYEDGDDHNWDNLMEYESCVDAVDCPNDVAGTDMKASLKEDIESKKSYWGRDWDIINSAPHQLTSVMALAAPVFAVVKYCYL
ncbi:hypothetical protein BsWGS_06053 [Bradybaena similaris]